MGKLIDNCEMSIEKKPKIDRQTLVSIVFFVFLTDFLAFEINDTYQSTGF